MVAENIKFKQIVYLDANKSHNSVIESKWTLSKIFLKPPWGFSSITPKLLQDNEMP